MPLRNSFSIRKLFSSPHRLAHMVDEPVSATVPLSTRTSRGQTKRSANTTPKSSDVTIDSDHNNNNSQSPELHPDSSITTPQAERGLVDNVVHELSQDEIDRIKAVVAAAAAAAATNLRLRMAEEADGNEGNEGTEEKERKGDASSPPEPRKKSRRVPQPIVVPPRPLSLTLGTRAGRCCSCRHSREKGDDIKTDGQDTFGDASEDGISVAVPLSAPLAASLSLEPAQAQPQPLPVVAGNSKSDTNTSTTGTGASRQRGSKPEVEKTEQREENGPKEEREKTAQTEQKEGAMRERNEKEERDKNDKDHKDGKSDQNPLGPASSASSPCITPPLAPAKASLTKPACLDSTLLYSFASEPISSIISLPPLSATPHPSVSSVHQHHRPHRPIPVFDPPPTLHHKKPAYTPTRASLPLTLASTPAVSSPLASLRPLYSAPPAAARLSSIFSARHKDIPEPAKHVARSKSRTRLRSKKARSSSKSGARRSKTKAHTQPHTQIQTLAQATSSEVIDPESLIHPVYRGQYAQTDGKKDSGISLDTSQPSLILSSIEKETLLSNTGDHEHDDSDSDVSYSDAGSCLDLLQALAIQPEEAIQLHQIELAKAHATTTSTANANMPSFDSIRSHVRIEKVDTKVDSAVPAPLFDGATTPTFTRPRRAPSPAVPPLPHTSSHPPLLKSSPLCITPPNSPPTTKTDVNLLPPSPITTVSTKKQTRFLPALRLTKGGPSSAASVTRQRSKKVSPRKRAAVAQAASKRAPLTGGSHVDLGGKSNSSSRWALPDNVTELFNGRLFNRMEVTETLSFEKLQAIRQSRALAEKQKREREIKEQLEREAKAGDERLKAELKEKWQKKHEAEEMDKWQGAQLANAEQALLEALERPVTTDAAFSPLTEDSGEEDDHALKRKNMIDTQSSVKTEKDDTADVEELEVSPLEPDVPSSGGDPFPAHAAHEQLVDIAVSPTSPTPPPPSRRSSQDDSTRRLPPANPLPPPPHIASQMVWHDDDASDDGSPPPSSHREVVSTNLLLPEAAEPDGSMTPLEPFHMQDLPSRIDAASVRVSILLPVEEEEAYFASSVAEHKERRRREREEQEREERNKEVAKEKKEIAIVSEAESLAIAGNKSEHAPSPPSKNPRRFSMQQHKTRAPPPSQLPISQPSQPIIPRVTVTDFDSHGQPSVTFSLPAPGPPRSPRSPPSPRRAKSDKDACARSSHSIPWSSITTTSQRDEETYVYLPATPFSLVMPSFRHGPVRLLRPEQDSLLFSNSNSNSMAKSASPISTRRKHMAAVDETLDWTAFQMAILGGAGDFFQESVDFGRTSATEVDEADSLSEWYLSMGFYPERLLTSEDDDLAPATAKQAAQTPDRAQKPAAARAPAPSLTNNQHAHWASFGSASDSSYNDCNARHSGQSDKTSSSTQSTQSIQSMQSSQNSNRFVDNVGAFYGMHGSHTMTNTNLPVRFSGHVSIDAGSVGSVGSVNNNTTTLALPAVSARLEMPASRTPSPSLFSRRNARPVELQGSVLEPSDQPKHRKNTASCASFDSYESMPQSPMADLVMTRGADGQEYVTPMGYNLGHDLGDFLRWETENVYALGD